MTDINSGSEAAPRAFLSFSFGDKDVAEHVAKALIAKGVDTWWAGWEIRAGDSFRRKIDEGLGNCTHFIVLLSPGALKKPWVQEEMDAGVLRQIEGQARFITLRHGLSVAELPPLLRTRLSPELNLEKFDQCVGQLVHDIYGVALKPPLGPTPPIVSLPDTSYSKVATAIGREFVLGSRHGMLADPERTQEELASAIGVSEEDIEDALVELGALVTVNSRNTVRPQDEFFVGFDGHFMPWNPEEDAKRLAIDLVGDAEMPMDPRAIASRYGWEPRRLNPALTYLISRGLIDDLQVASNEYVTVRVRRNADTRRFVKNMKL